MLILVTGGTGFVGKALIRHLVENDYSVRTLLRPSPVSPNLPRGVPVDVTVSSLDDERGLRAAMVGVEVIYHLASGEWRGTQSNLLEIDINGTRAIIEAARDAKVKQIIYVSHLGADRASAFPVLKAKGIAEEFIRRSGINYTIVRSAIIFGKDDGFSTGIVKTMAKLPLIFLVPGDGKVLLQPIWIEDLATCLTWLLDDPEVNNRTMEVGGPEFLSFEGIIHIIMETAGISRRLIKVRPPYLRALTVLGESIYPNLPISVYWLDYLATNRTCSLDTMPRVFNIIPSKFSQRLDYLEETKKRQIWSRKRLLRS